MHMQVEVPSWYTQGLLPPVEEDAAADTVQISETLAKHSLEESCQLPAGPTAESDQACPIKFSMTA